MRRRTRTTVRLYWDGTFLLDDFADDLERLKEESSLTWDGLYALLKLDAQVPGCVQMVLRTSAMPHPGPLHPVRIAVGTGGVNG